MIYLVRHGESIANIEEVYQGQTYDTDLSPKGKDQVASVARYFKELQNENQEFDEIWVSPLTRTKQTAQPISTALGVPYKVEPLLLETDHGVWAGKGKDWVCDNYMPFCEIWWNKPSQADFPKGEKFTQVVKRAREVLEKADPNKDYIFVSHDNTIRAILSVAQDRDVDKMWDYPLENACISVLEFKDGKYDLKEIIVEHLNGIRSDLAQQLQ